jgi:hypothetical protein
MEVRRGPKLMLSTGGEAGPIMARPCCGIKTAVMTDVLPGTQEDCRHRVGCTDHGPPRASDRGHAAVAGPDDSLVTVALQRARAVRFRHHWRRASAARVRRLAKSTR